MLRARVQKNKKEEKPKKLLKPQPERSQDLIANWYWPELLCFASR